MTWQRDDAALYEKEKAEVETHFPELRFVVENELAHVRGSFAAMFEGQVLDSTRSSCNFQGTISPDFLSSAKPAAASRAVTTAI